MFDAQQALVAALVQGGNRGVLCLRPGATLIQVADDNRIKHCGYAGGRALRVVHHHGGMGVPQDSGPRCQVLLQVVGVQFHQSRQHPVASPVLAISDRRGPRIHGTNQIAVHHQIAGKFFIGRHKTGVSDNALRHLVLPCVFATALP